MAALSQKIRRRSRDWRLELRLGVSYGVSTAQYAGESVWKATDTGASWGDFATS